MRPHTEAFEHRCLYTQKHLYRDTLTYARLYTQKLLHTDCFSENHRSFDTEKPLHYTENFFTHRSFYTQTVAHRSLYEKLLRTGAFAHKRLYTQKLVYTEAFTHRSSYTDKPYTEQLLHASKSQIYWVFDVRPSCHAKGLRLALENCSF